MKKLMCAWLLLAVSGLAQAAPQVEADPSKLYMISPEVGPWVILAASYSGPNALEMARQAVFCVRQRDHLPAFIFNHGDEERKKQEADIARQRELYKDTPGARIRRVKIEDECAVLIGGFRDMESASDALVRVKKLEPPSIDLGANIVTAPTLYKFEPGKKPGDNGGYRLYAVNPFASSFVSRNPTIPHEPVGEKKVDPLLKELNADEEFSLFKAKQPYTIMVKEYVGLSQVNTTQKGSNSMLERLGLSNNSAKVLGASAMQAHETAAILRKWNFDAYVLHTRGSSIVTVGSFDSEDDVRLQRQKQQLANLAKNPSMTLLQLAAEPMVVKIPAIK